MSDQPIEYIGSDAPPLLPLLPRAKRIIEEFPFTEAERADVFGGNALKLLEILENSVDTLAS